MGKNARLKREKFLKVQEAREIEGLVKKLRFWDRFVALNKNPTQEYQAMDHHPPKPDAVINADSCFDTLNDKGGEPWFVIDDLVAMKMCMKPPFDTCFLEYDCTAEYPLEQRMLTGISALLTEATAWNAKSPQAHWVIECFVFWFRGAGAVFDRIKNVYMHTWDDKITEMEGGMFIELDQHFRPLEVHGDHEDRFDLATGDKMFSAAAVLMQFLAIVNCRNIVLVDTPPSPNDNAIYQRHFDVPMTKYKTLAIKPMGKRYEGDKPQQSIDVMPLHLRRGNFAHYTADAPLFGKYTGTFWRPATVVGSEKNGIVVKDYKVKPEVEVSP